MADPTTSPPLTRTSVFAARELIQPFVHRTPVVTSRSLSALASSVSPWTSSRPSAALPTASTFGPGEKKEEEGKEKEDSSEGAGPGPAAQPPPTLRLWFKCENFQRVGAFKARGAFHAIERLKREPGWLEGGGPERGVVTHSSGNHAQALALAARTNGIPAHIVMPSISAPPKIAATRGYGARVVFSGSTSSEREAATALVVERTGARLVPPYDHPDIVLGQGTLGLEFQEDVAAQLASAGGPPYADAAPPLAERRLDAILAPCGGGGMLAGVALACEGTGVRVFGAEPSRGGADDARRGFARGERVTAVSSLTVADGLRTPMGRVPWAVAYERRLVAGVYSVGDRAIRRALRLAYERLKLVLEPSAAVPLAVALFDPDFRAMAAREAGPRGWDLGIVLSGGNVDLDALAQLLALDGDDDDDDDAEEEEKVVEDTTTATAT
ncbi:tryptophan synthase beta subunit-like PLP-dependent enzyme [Durotheca rogersii]|uniref:tryptophan synthase beta subunit-like PLP-dependent enzyme n=1 Tax=Durotheca rogersii TaxID=419775 RepID=UPI00221E58E0|nr:tryptophan synthase beta subunit-like PLP-dependent enzyme [Durotheca rogersii]KAI5860255.1 tryptophan synthase beta subunit-like PLP-dependent enzyme [Durotheca rogersii]